MIHKPKIIKPNLFRMGFIFCLVSAMAPVLLMYRLDLLAHSDPATQSLGEASLMNIGILGAGALFLILGVMLLRLSVEIAQKNEKGTSV
jgi:hypothetical protein